MKIKREYYKELKRRIETMRDMIPSHYEYVIKEGKAKDVNKRVRWDAFWASKFHDDFEQKNHGLDGVHIDTALKRIFKELGLVRSVKQETTL
jgi:hypothetical protein